MCIKTTTLRFFALAALCLVSATVSAAEKPAGPNHGHILNTEPRAEFFVTADRRVQITFLDRSNRAVAPDGQVVTVTAGDRANPTTLKFARSGGALLSDVALPPGDNVPAVVQIKAVAGAKTSIDKFNVDLTKCPDCKKPEYACTCH